MWDVDAIKQLVLQGTEGDDNLVGFSTGDLIQGYAGNDRLYGRDGDDSIDGGAGNDRLYGENGNDTLQGGEGNDYIEGGAGTDTYVFGRGDGQDVIIDFDDTLGNTDTVLLKDDVGPADLRLKASGLDLCIEVIDTDDRLIIKGWFADDRNKIERIQFADGTVWDKAAIQDLASRPTDTDDYLVGTQYSDGIDGGGGNGDNRSGRQ